MTWVTCGRNSSYSFIPNVLETLQMFLSWSEDVHVLLGLSSHYYLFSTFSGPD